MDTKELIKTIDKNLDNCDTFNIDIWVDEELINDSINEETLSKIEYQEENNEIIILLINENSNYITEKKIIISATSDLKIDVEYGNRRIFDGWTINKEERYRNYE